MAQANVDLNSINSLDSALNQAASSLASLRGEVRAFIDNAVTQARQVVNNFQQEENEAQRNYDIAYNIYHSCLCHQRYDEETGKYTPSCSCEQRDLNNASDTLSKARRKREEAETCLIDMERERDQYLSKYNPDYRMSEIISELAPDASRRLSVFREFVQNHETMQSDLSSSSLGLATSSGITQESTANMYDNTTDSTSETVHRFREGMRRIKEKQEEQQRMAIFRWITGGTPNERTR